MSVIPSAIIFVNNDLVDQVINFLVRQLHLTEVIDGAEFDSRVAADPDYVITAKSLDQRIMVIRPFNDYTNRELADVAAFAKNGMFSIEKNNFGPPIKQIKIADIHWGKFCIFRTTFPQQE